MPAWSTHIASWARSSSVKPNRRRTGSAEARSSTSVAVTRPPASSTRTAARLSRGLVLDGARSARRTRSRCAGCPSPVPVTSASPNPAWTRGAYASMSGHITRMSRGSRVGSSASRPTSTSRSTSTWRAAPWHACTCTDRSPSRRARASRLAAPGSVLARRSCCSQPSSVSAWSPSGGSGAAPPPVEPVETTDSVRCSSRASRPSDPRSGCRTSSPARSSSRGTGPDAARPARSSHREPETCGSHRCTSRSSPSAPSSSTSVTGRRVCPKSDSRGGRSRPSPPLRSRSSVSVWRTSGGSPPTRFTRRRHSSACHRRSSSSLCPAPSRSWPSRQSVTSRGRWTAYDAKSPAMRRATE